MIVIHAAMFTLLYFLVTVLHSSFPQVHATQNIDFAPGWFMG